jgi:hypothetical protein
MTIRWSTAQGAYSANLQDHWARAQALGLNCPRRVAVPRPCQHAADESRWRTLEEDLQDERPEIIEHWRMAGTWLRAPILVAGEVTDTSLGNECLVGFTLWVICLASWTVRTSRSTRLTASGSVARAQR